MWMLNFLKGRVRYRNIKVKIYKKVWVVSKKHTYMFYIASLSDNFLMRMILVNISCPFVAYICVFFEKSPKKTLNIMMWLKGWGGSICWCSDLHITSKWSSKRPCTFTETVLCHDEYLIFGRRVKFGKISILAIFSYHFMYYLK